MTPLGDCVPIVDLSGGKELDKDDFFRKYVMARQPVVIRNYSFGNNVLFSDEDVLDVCGAHSVVHYEEPSPDGAVASVAQKAEPAPSDFGALEAVDRQSLPLGDLLSRRDETWYLTTQPIRSDDRSGLHLELCGPHIWHKGVLRNQPLSLLEDVFETGFTEGVFGGKLVPFQYNMWMGNTPRKSSRSAFASTSSSEKHATNPRTTKTPLHHDAHDNVYLVCQGRKEFRLFPPEMVANATIASTGKKTPAAQTTAAKRLTHIPTAGSTEVDIVVHWNGLISYDNDFRPDGALKSAVRAWTRRQKSTTRVSEHVHEEFGFSTSDEEDSGSDVDDLLEQSSQSPATTEGEVSARTAPTSPALPDHFSTVPTCEKLAEKGFPHRPLTVLLGQGDLLYLPASWFHEVLSTPVETDAEGNGAGANAPNGGADGRHLALNAWYHPPGRNRQQKPYTDDFWRSFHDRVMRPNTLAARTSAAAANGGEAGAGAGTSRKRDRTAMEVDPCDEEVEKMCPRKYRIARKRERWWAANSRQCRFTKWKQEVETFKF